MDRGASGGAIRRESRFKTRGFPYFLHVPTFIVLGLILVYPWLWSLYLSFTSWNPTFSPNVEWIGLDNYLWILTDPLFWLSFGNTMKLLVVSISLEAILGLAAALALHRALRAVGFFRTVTLLSYVISPAVVGLIWRTLLHGEWGLVNWVFKQIGLNPVGWLGDPQWSLVTIIIVEVWRHLPYVAIILLAGLQGVPSELYEASKVDGASGRQTLWHVTLPVLRPVLMVVLMFRAMFVLRTFDTVYVMFGGGGPANSASVLGVYLYDTFKVSWELGMGAAISFMLLGTTALISGFFVYIMRER